MVVAPETGGQDKHAVLSEHGELVVAELRLHGARLLQIGIELFKILAVGVIMVGDEMLVRVRADGKDHINQRAVRQVNVDVRMLGEDRDVGKVVELVSNSRVISVWK